MKGMFVLCGPVGLGNFSIFVLAYHMAQEALF